MVEIEDGKQFNEKEFIEQQGMDYEHFLDIIHDCANNPAFKNGKEIIDHLLGGEFSQIYSSLSEKGKERFSAIVRGPFNVFSSEKYKRHSTEYLLEIK